MTGLSPHVLEAGHHELRRAGGRHESLLCGLAQHHPSLAVPTVGTMLGAGTQPWQSQVVNGDKGGGAKAPDGGPTRQSLLREQQESKPAAGGYCPLTEMRIPGGALALDTRRACCLLPCNPCRCHHSQVAPSRRGSRMPQWPQTLYVNKHPLLTVRDTYCMFGLQSCSGT